MFSNDDIEPRLKVDMIGLAGGVLATFLDRHFDIDLRVIELDAEIINIARTWFNFPSKIPVIIEDGVKFVSEQSQTVSQNDESGMDLFQNGAVVDVLMIDAGMDDDSVLSCPPAAFLSPQFLRAVKSYLKERGFVAINIISRSKSVVEDVLKKLSDVFEHVAAVKVDEDVNHVVFGASRAIAFERDFSGPVGTSWIPNWNPLLQQWIAFDS